MSRRAWVPLMMAMSASAALFAIVARRGARKLGPPPIAAPSHRAFSVESPDVEDTHPATNGSRPEFAPVASVPPPVVIAPAPPLTRRFGDVQAELARSVAPRRTPANDELRQLLRLPEMTLAPAVERAAPRRQRSRLRVVSSELLAGIRQLHAESYSVYVITASFVALIALGAMYLTISGGGNDARSFAVTGSPPASDAPSGEVSGAESPSLADQALDARRALDLGELRDAANSYAHFFGKYPSTAGAFTTVCVLWTDPFCDVIAHGRGLPVSDGTLPYWYASDGTSFTLMAQMQTWPDVDSCPDKVPPQVGAAPVACVVGALAQR